MPPVSRSPTLTSGMFGRVDLLHRRHHRLDVDRREHEASRSGAQCLVDQGGLLRDVVGRGRDVVKHRDAVRLRHRVGARAHRAGDRVARALGEDGEGLGGGRRRRPASGRRSRPRTKHHGVSSLLPLTTCGAARAPPSCSYLHFAAVPIRVVVANCHSGRRWLKLNNNKKKQTQAWEGCNQASPGD